MRVECGGAGGVVLRLAQEFLQRSVFLLIKIFLAELVETIPFLIHFRQDIGDPYQFRMAGFFGKK